MCARVLCFDASQLHTMIKMSRLSSRSPCSAAYYSNTINHTTCGTLARSAMHNRLACLVSSRHPLALEACISWRNTQTWVCACRLEMPSVSAQPYMHTACQLGSQTLQGQAACVKAAGFRRRPKPSCHESPGQLLACGSYSSGTHSAS